MKTQPDHPDQLPRGPKTSGSNLGRFAALPSLRPSGRATRRHRASETFDSGRHLHAWSQCVVEIADQRRFNPTLSPDTDWGKGVRIQGLTYGGALPAAVAFMFRTNVYQDFYVAVDFVAWAELDQAILLIAHGTDVDPPQNSSSYIINYDVLQDGETATDRLGGQLQLSVVSPGFATQQLGIGEFTLVPGRALSADSKGCGEHNHAGCALTLPSKPTITLI